MATLTGTVKIIPERTRFEGPETMGLRLPRFEASSGRFKAGYLAKRLGSAPRKANEET